jgi:hypothetical protein
MSLHVMSDDQHDSLVRVITERMAQDKKWGVQNHRLPVWLAILGEEYGEACKAFLEGDGEGYHKEVVQIAAVALAMLEHLERVGRGEVSA